MRKTSIIILAQHASMLKPCLASIRLYTEGTYELVVVNDGGTKELARWLQNEKDVRILTSPVRQGVAAGYNEGAAIAEGANLVFMRDHMIVSENWLKNLTGCLDRHEDAAMAGALSNGLSGDQGLPLACGTMRESDVAARAFTEGQAGQSKRVTRLLSHLLLVRRSAFEHLGGFDERYGLESYEDDDLCYRALQAGYSLHIALDCFIRYMAPPSPVPEDPGWYGKLLQANQVKAWEKWGFDLTAALQSWPRRVTVSLCMIVRDEEMTLDSCLSSIREHVDEIILVDTGSTDRTKEIARRYTNRIYDFEWVDDFALARNYAFSLATQEYILWLDADDTLTPRDAESFGQLVAALPWTADAVSMNYDIAFDEDGNVITSLRRNRLVRREKGFKWIGAVHEYLEVWGNLVSSPISITHARKHANSSRNLRIYEQRQAEGKPFTSRDMFYFANELADHQAWERAVEQYDLFLGQASGWIEDRIRACGRAADCLLALGRTTDAKTKALQSFTYTAPRAENCCRLGYYALSEKDLETAVFWYKLAAELPRPSDSGAILDHASWTWLPHLQLCVCYDQLGQRELAYQHHLNARRYVPSHSSVVANQAYFDQTLLSI